MRGMRAEWWGWNRPSARFLVRFRRTPSRRPSPRTTHLCRRSPTVRISVKFLVLGSSVSALTSLCTSELNGRDVHEGSSFLVSARAFSICRGLSLPDHRPRQTPSGVKSLKSCAAAGVVLGIGQTFGEVPGPLPQKTIPAPISADDSLLQKATPVRISVTDCGSSGSGQFGLGVVQLGAQWHGYPRGLQLSRLS